MSLGGQSLIECTENPADPKTPGQQGVSGDATAFSIIPYVLKKSVESEPLSRGSLATRREVFHKCLYVPRSEGKAYDVNIGLPV